MATKSATKEELAVRYDRQVRLWGSQTQQRLQQTALHVHWEDSFAGAGAELVKNLVLGGIGRLTVSGANCSSDVTMEELQTNLFLLQRSGRLKDGQLNKAEAVVEGLSALNPFVSVSTVPLTSVLLSSETQSASQPEGEGEALMVVILIGCSGEQLLGHYETLKGAAKKGEEEDSSTTRNQKRKVVLVSINHVGRNVLAVLTPVVVAATAEEEGDRTVGKKSPVLDGSASAAGGNGSTPVPPSPLQYLLQDQTYLLLQPEGYRTIAGSLFPEQLTGSNGDSPQTNVTPATSSSSITESATMGGLLSQQLIARIGKGLEGGSDPKDYTWLLLEATTCQVSCITGTM